MFAQMTVVVLAFVWLVVFVPAVSGQEHTGVTVAELTGKASRNVSVAERIPLAQPAPDQLRGVESLEHARDWK
jgi:hypothetical protein